MAKKNPGVWLSYDNSSNVVIDVAVHGSELSALRRAVEIGGRSVWVEHNQTLEDAIAGRPTAAEGAIPGEDPLPLDDKPKRNRPSRAKSKPDLPADERPAGDKPADD